MVNTVVVILSFCSIAFAKPSHSVIYNLWPNGTRCPPVVGKPSCACQPPGEAMIDLTPLSNSDGIPRFPRIVSHLEKDDIYSFNPCQPFTLLQRCLNVSTCLTSDDYPNQFPIGFLSSEQIWIDTDGKKYLKYTGSNGRERTLTVVYLECDHSATEPIITIKGEYYTAVRYIFHLKSCHACPGGCNIAPPSPSPAVGPTLCPPISGEPPCKCQHPEGIIDLTPLASLNGTARFTGILTEKNLGYSYNPCQGFQQGSCWNVHVCRVLVGSHETTSIAEVGTEAIYYDSNGLAHAHYRGPGQIQTKVYLECDQETKNAVITTVNDAHCPLIFEFIVKSCQVCPGGCKEQLKSQLPPGYL